MTRKRLWLFDSSTKLTMYSVIVSAMVSESRTFTVNEFPEWSRLFWLVWLFIPVLFSTIISTFEALRADWLAGCQFISEWSVEAIGLMLPVGVATG